jgi:hypothetical protein
MALTALCRASHAKLDLRRLVRLHGNEVGSVQSLSFVLVLPLFVMIVLFIVQVSQLMIATVVVHYAAYSAARTAAVWIPANLSGGEGPNCISSYSPDPSAGNQTMPSLLGPTSGGMWFVIQPGSPKYNKITSAAAMALMSICPSRDVGVTLPSQDSAAADVLKTAYSAFLPASTSNSAISGRIEHKLAYALANTTVELRFYHQNSEPPLATYGLASDAGEFYANEIDWQDEIEVTVRHNFALLPGPGRFLAQHLAGSDPVADAISNQGGVYTYPLSASATIGNEGERPLLSYVRSNNN